jgi:N-acetylglutamate synthase-like GNAT family acetyltransferase
LSGELVSAFPAVKTTISEIHIKEDIMEKEECPKGTGISGITGKIVKVRHATEADMGFIVEYSKRYGLDEENLSYNQFVVAMENGFPVGFGRLKKTGEAYEIGCVVVMDEKKYQGVDSLIINHLIDFSPVKTVYVISDLVDYFKKLGFTEAKAESTELINSLDKACRMGGKENAVLMVYKKN